MTRTAQHNFEKTNKQTKQNFKKTVHVRIQIQVTLKHFGRHCGLVVRALAPVVQKINSAIHRINLNPGDNAIGFSNTYPVNSPIQLLNNWVLDSVSGVQKTTTQKTKTQKTTTQKMTTQKTTTQKTMIQKTTTQKTTTQKRTTQKTTTQKTTTQKTTTQKTMT